MAKTLQQLYDERQALYASQYDAQKQAAEQAKVKGTTDLEAELAKQRNAYQGGIQVASQDSFARGRRMINSLAGRGLATSGLAQLGDVQGKIATGKTLSALGTANAEVTKAGMAERTNLEQTYANAIRQAQLDLTGKNLASDELITQQTAADEAANLQKKENILAAKLELENAIKSGTLTPEEVQVKIKQYEELYGPLNAGGELDTSILSQDLYDKTYGEKVDFGGIGKTAGGMALAGGAVGTAVAPGPGTVVGSLVGGAGGAGAGILMEAAQALGLSQGIGGIGGNYRFNIGGVSENYKSIDDAVAKVNELYNGSPMSDKIKAVAGKNNNSIVFSYGGKTYKTYNEAAAAAKTAK